VFFYLVAGPIEAFMGSTKSPIRSPKRGPRLQNQIAKSLEQALGAFVSNKKEIDTMLTRLQALSDDHFGYSPDEITRSHAEGLAHYAELLKRITDQAFNKGEHAE
jgi:hypothetical protein